MWRQRCNWLAWLLSSPWWWQQQKLQLLFSSAPHLHPPSKKTLPWNFEQWNWRVTARPSLHVYICVYISILLASLGLNGNFTDKYSSLWQKWGKKDFRRSPREGFRKSDGLMLKSSDVEGSVSLVMDENEASSRSQFFPQRNTIVKDLKRTMKPTQQYLNTLLQKIIIAYYLTIHGSVVFVILVKPPL